MPAHARSLLSRRFATAIALAAPTALFLVLLGEPARAQTPDDLKNEVETLRRDYEARIKALEERLAALERQNGAASQKPEVAAIAPSVSAQDAASEMLAPNATSARP